MRLSVILFLSLILYISMANAKQKTNHTSISQLIQTVKNSSGDNRRVAMNALKVRLRSMNQETRQGVMRDLQKSFANNQRSMQRSVQSSTTPQGTMRTGSTGNTGGVPLSGGIQTGPSQTSGHASPTTVPQQPPPSAPSAPHIPQQSVPSVPQQQVPHTQPSTPQRPSPQMPSPHFGQPGGRR